MSQNNFRRAFLKQGMIYAAAAVAAKVAFFTDNTGFAQTKKKKGKKGGADSCPPLANPSEGMAAGLNYVHDKGQAKPENKIARGPDKSVAFKDQFCHNCSFYNKNAGCKGQKVGNCTMLSGFVVKDDGICNSWAKKS